MTQPDPPAHRTRPHGPTRRSDSTRPPHTRPSSRREGDRRPWPTASTTTRISPAKPGPTATRARSHGSAATPTPATVWTAGAAPIDLVATWPTSIVSSIVGAFSKPGAEVVLLPWSTTPPTPHQTPGTRHRLGVVDADGVIRHAPGAAPNADNDTELSDALVAVESLNRTGRVAHLATDGNVTGPVSRPFWADLVGDSVNLSPPSPAGVDPTVLDGPDDVSPDSVAGAANSADLIITSLRPEHGGTQSGDLVALVAARLLRVGGILAVLTHCDWPVGELIDPTGEVVAAAQNADLLYLQHIVALHVPVRDGQFATEHLTNPEGSAADAHTRAAHRAAVRGLPAPHRRIHSDVLIFATAKSHELHRSLAASSAEQTSESGVLR